MGLEGGGDGGGDMDGADHDKFYFFGIETTGDFEEVGDAFAERDAADEADSDGAGAIGAVDDRKMGGIERVGDDGDFFGGNCCMRPLRT